MAVAHSDEVRLFPTLPSQPLVESAGGDKATMPAECIAEGRFFPSCFRTGVDELVADRRVFRPERDEAPTQEDELATGARRRRNDQSAHHAYNTRKRGFSPADL